MESSSEIVASLKLAILEVLSKCLSRKVQYKILQKTLRGAVLYYILNKDSEPIDALSNDDALHPRFLNLSSESLPSQTPAKADPVCIRGKPKRCVQRLHKDWCP